MSSTQGNSEFADKTSAPQAVNETKSFDALGFGFAGWKIAVSKYTVTRKNDRTLKMPDGREIKTRFYTSELQLPMGTFTGQTWTDDAGVFGGADSNISIQKGWSVSSDGQRILGVRDVMSESDTRRITVVQNWYREFEKP